MARWVSEEQLRRLLWGWGASVVFSTLRALGGPSAPSRTWGWDPPPCRDSPCLSLLCFLSDAWPPPKSQQPHEALAEVLVVGTLPEGPPHYCRGPCTTGTGKALGPGDSELWLTRPSLGLRPP